jgi:transcriptional regulator with XRE-family HTH domain
MRELPARFARSASTTPFSPLLEDAVRAELVGNRIRDLRESAGLTQTQLAQRAELPQSHISRLENAESSPSERTLRKIAKALRVPLERINPYAAASDYPR